MVYHGLLSSRECKEDTQQLDWQDRLSFDRRNWADIPCLDRISRRMLLGSVKKLQVEDLLMIIAMVRQYPLFFKGYSIGLTICAVYRYTPHGRHVHHFANEQ